GHPASATSVAGAAAAVGADHELVDQIRQIYGALHVADALARSQHLAIAADIQQDVVVAEQPVAGHHRGRVLGQLDGIVHLDRDHRLIGLRVEMLVGHRADLDAGDPYIGADPARAATVEPKLQRIAARLPPDLRSRTA